MMVFKYPITGKLGVVQDIAMGAGAEILTVQPQDNTLCLWARVDELATPETRQFVVYGTGWPMDDSLNLVYRGTAQVSRLVWHVFEVVANGQE